MSDDHSDPFVAEFLRRLTDANEAQVELDLGFEIAEERDAPALRVSGDLELDDLAGRSLRIRLPDSSDETGWVAEGTWQEDGTVTLGSIRRVGSQNGSLEHSRSDYRVAIPPSSVAALTRLDTDETFSVEPVDLSRGGIGLRADGDLPLEAGERVEVDLNVVGEFAGTLVGRVAFARNGEEDDARIGIAFEELDPEVSEALNRALNNILLGKTEQIT